MHEVSTEAVTAKARGIAVVPPLTERRHRLVQVSHRQRAKSENLTPRVWLDYTFLGLADDMLVVFALREEESPDHRERTRGSSTQGHHQVLGGAGSEEDFACGRR